LTFIILVTVVTWSACGPNWADNCEELSEEIIELSKKGENVILKMYSIKREDAVIRGYFQYTGGTNDKVVLGCTADAKWRSGGDDPVLFWDTEDPDGERFIGYVRIR